MRKSSKVILASAIGVGIAASAISTTFAAEPNTSPTTSLVNAVAAKFNLNPSDVQKVFDEQHSIMKSQMSAQMQQKIEGRIKQAVTEGKLTQAQADKIIAYLATVKTQIAALDGKTPEERAAGMKQIMTAATAWATANNIPTQYLMMGGFGHGFGGAGKMKGFGTRMHKATTTPATNL